jgi:hypothetical protein
MAVSNFTTSNVKEIVIDRFFEGLHSVSERWASAYDYRTDDVSSLRVSPITGVGQIPEWNGDADLDIVGVAALDAQSVDYETYGVQVRVNKYDAMDVPESTTALPQRIGIATASTYAAKGAELLANAFTTATTSYDGLALVSASHTVATGGTRSNKLTSALDSTAIMAAIALFRKWLDYQGLPMDVAEMGGFYLIIPPDLETAAGQALGSEFTSAALQVNMAGSYGIDTIVWNQLSDTNNWFLVSKAMSPLIFWERSAPDLNIEIDPDNKSGKYSLDFAIKASASAIPDGIVGSLVA